MYTKAELFNLACEQPKEIFTGNVTLSVPDDACGEVDFDAEKARLCCIWDAAHMTVGEILKNFGFTQVAFGKELGIPRRTVQSWCLGDRECPTYVRFLIAEHFDLL